MDEMPAKAGRIGLPEPARVGGPPVWETMQKRRSIRRHARTPLDLSAVSQLLWCSAGQSGESERFRTPASAGGKHPADTLLVANRVSGLPPGMYRYIPGEHSLEPVASGDFGGRLAEACGQAMLRDSAIVLAWEVQAERTTSKYGERGQRYILMDLGHVCQNVYLGATALGLGCCAIGAFKDAQVNSIFGISGKPQAVLYMATIGFPLD